MDNGSTHAPKQLLDWFNQKQHEQDWQFTIEPVWLPKYASWLDQIEIWLSILLLKAFDSQSLSQLGNFKRTSHGFYLTSQCLGQTDQVVIYHSAAQE